MDQQKQNVDHQRTIDQAVSDCHANIRRHARSSLMEVFVALILLTVVGVLLVLAAQIQAADNDRVRERIVTNTIERTKYQNAMLEELRRYRLKESGLGGTRTKEDVDVLIKQAAKNSDFIDAAEKEARSFVGEPILPDKLILPAGGFVVLVLGLLSGLYRFHLREMVKNEQYKLALMRIRIAANNADKPGFDGEVRTSLTKNAFEVPQSEIARFPRRKIDSPMEGHPTIDLATLLINRLLEEAEIVLQPKAKK